MSQENPTPFWQTSNGLAAIALIIGVMYFLLTEHLAHTIAFLPYGILLLCPLIHIFMHGAHGHGGHDGHDHERHDHKGGPDDAR